MHLQHYMHTLAHGMKVFTLFAPSNGGDVRPKTVHRNFHNLYSIMCIVPPPPIKHFHRNWVNLYSARATYPFLDGHRETRAPCLARSAAQTESYSAPADPKCYRHHWPGLRPSMYDCYPYRTNSFGHLPPTTDISPPCTGSRRKYASMWSIRIGQPPHSRPTVSRRPPERMRLWETTASRRTAGRRAANRSDSVGSSAATCFQ